MARGSAGRCGLGAFFSGLAVALTAAAIAVPAWPQTPGETPLAHHRARIRAAAPDAAVLQGRIRAVHGPVIVTTVGEADWRGVGGADGDLVILHVGARTLRARFLDRARYEQMLADPAWRDALDVDVLCTVDAGLLVVVGPDGLVDWLRAGRQAPITVVRP